MSTPSRSGLCACSVVAVVRRFEVRPAGSEGAVCRWLFFACHRCCYLRSDLATSPSVRSVDRLCGFVRAAREAALRTLLVRSLFIPHSTALNPAATPCLPALDRLSPLNGVALLCQLQAGALPVPSRRLGDVPLRGPRVAALGALERPRQPRPRNQLQQWCVVSPALVCRLSPWLPPPLCVLTFPHCSRFVAFAPCSVLLVERRCAELVPSCCILFRCVLQGRRRAVPQHQQPAHPARPGLGVLCTSSRCLWRF